MSRRTALFLMMAIMSGCSSEEQTPEVQKLESSELHILGSFCQGDYYRISGSEFSFFESGKKNVIFDNVKLVDIGSRRIEMTSKYKGLITKTTLLLESESNVIRFENVTYDLPNDIANRDGKLAFLAKNAANITSAPKMTLCPTKSPQEKVQG
ncbi:hypothetical protein [Rhizobium rhizogenes]|uniref:hypothetical protein n=1 Tax=Rhizobium rhizogenes TaxID=359 RepID=UPI001AED96BC|nr:hypothetical protein [Rhizobium rhizogenes]NTH22992.1 hypothetical protein [Rhizobium rhizogenes]